MTRDELIIQGCGIYIDTRDASNYQRKVKNLYIKNGVCEFFKARREYYKKGGATPFTAGKQAQAEPDELLFKQAAVIGSTTPATQAAILTPFDNSGLHDIAEFGEAAVSSIDPIRDLTWIYNNIAVKDVKPSEAPSPGAYAYLRWVQKDEQNEIDFFTKVYPRIIPAKSQIDKENNFNDDNRSTFDLLNRLSGEGKDGSGEIRVL